MTNNLNQFTTHHSLLTQLSALKQSAFTLAETLIVMGIIGVVAALTLPNLNNSTGDKEKVVKVKKIYQNLNDAMGRAVAVYGPFEDWFINDANATAQTTRAGERLTEFMKLSKNCKMTKGCYTSGTGTSTNYELILSDGTSLSIFTSARDISISVDIDGLNKGKNKYGYDRFGFGNVNSDDKNNLIPYGENWSPSTMTFGSSTLIASCAQGNMTSPSCTAWVVNYDNMDYLKLDSSGKCPNGKALNVLASPPVTSCN